VNNFDSRRLERFHPPLAVAIAGRQTGEDLAELDPRLMRPLDFAQAVDQDPALPSSIPPAAQLDGTLDTRIVDAGNRGRHR
jgi:hypothetical protein